MITFAKYHALGNHFVIVDNRKCEFDLTPQVDRDLCDGRTGVGADCLLEVTQCTHPGHTDCRYHVSTHIPRGGLAGFCGNGNRCVVEFARRLGLVAGNEEFKFCGADGVHRGLCHLEEGLVEISIGDVNQIDCHGNDEYYIFTGSRFRVKFVRGLDDKDIKTNGERIAFHSHLYRQPTNTVLVEECRTGQVRMRSYEHGARTETWACGTGATAAALVTEFRNKFESPRAFVRDIYVKLGKVTIKAARTGEAKFEHISLVGPTSHVFDGVYVPQ